ncbi:MAG TPA: (2Fe-2S)-binding protein [Thermoanaerobaculia bacterium]|nr:(2Fe-2S)-binding protein [Thermoanaerobaculia bacterium]
MPAPIRFRLNGRPTSLETDDGRALLWVLRTDLGLTGAKYGCGAGACGACTVLVDGRAVRSCITPVSVVRDREVTTIEGLAHEGTLHPLQAAFVEHNGFQCGYCTSGMILSAAALLRETPAPSRETIAARLEFNLCRCGAHTRILDAVETVASAKGPASSARRRTAPAWSKSTPPPPSGALG